MKSVFILVIFTAIAAYAQRPKLVVVDEKLDATEFGPGYEVEKPEKVIPKFPTQRERNKFFQGFSLVKSYDELDKDLLYMDLHTKSLNELKKKYPEMPDEDLQKLKQKAGK